MTPKKTPPSGPPAKTPAGPSGGSIKNLKTLDSKCDSIAKDYERLHKGNLLRWRIEGADLIILFMDGRKFHFPMPPGWTT